MFTSLTSRCCTTVFFPRNSSASIEIWYMAPQPPATYQTESTRSQPQALVGGYLQRSGTWLHSSLQHTRLSQQGTTHKHLLVVSYLQQSGTWFHSPLQHTRLSQQETTHRHLLVVSYLQRSGTWLHSPLFIPDGVNKVQLTGTC